ncbi:MAG: biotin/lipoyl-containing protein, partial [Dysgonamonadaceae bacterium]
MMIEVKVPSPGESINEVELATWLVKSGDLVHKNQELAMIESDKATLSLIAPESGKIEILVQEGETVKVETVACQIDTSVEVPDEDNEDLIDADEMDEKIERGKEETEKKEDKADAKESKKESTGADSELEEKSVTKEPTTRSDQSKPSEDLSKVKVTPLARKMMEVENINVEDIIKGLKRISSDEVSAVLS